VAAPKALRRFVECFQPFCTVVQHGPHASEEVRRARASAGGAGLTWGAAALGLQAVPVLAAPGLSGTAEAMSGVRTAGAVLGGGVAAGVLK
jgi:hypothetical protein